MRTKACTRCGRVLAFTYFGRTGRGHVSRLCDECRAAPRFNSHLRRRPFGAAPPIDPPVTGSTDGLQPRERARHEMRVLAATLVAQMMD